MKKTLAKTKSNTLVKYEKTNEAVYMVNSVKKSVCCKMNYKGYDVYGLAKCAPEDTFNEAQGKKIAAMRAKLTIDDLHIKDLRQSREVLTSLINLSGLSCMKTYVEDLTGRLKHAYTHRAEDKAILKRVLAETEPVA